ncbi:hypothetical protein Q648_00058 [Bartonella quintana JK 12]|uniref:Uncharacterized protein n=2 Tax=Bartonella quintana TaxID=803 RepID=W3TYC9_BARQI|nr:hypothetical protein Q651_00446 [Bartonella quintana BQ2-D70]ETS13851.1 hypothetical protein Q650_00467 [Bartonella quintana JK 73rel]ETS15538.1 hypothetical protein Q649_00476 [Bartonella quintana JK 73]ETS17543.1 hypothetical protein Q647_00467 [Bartonella quintana JK 7]ETS18374.1 hypothetical protein Q648_00058 [Bartonella quintana JK 12]KEC59444.1 hypothetical protein O93_00775 [Bartonella quintana JK 19]KEC62447.1 hypothetical protein O7Y_00484 [Bartonella quintana JK 63]KEC63694.1 h
MMINQMVTQKKSLMSITMLFFRKNPLKVSLSSMFHETDTPIGKQYFLFIHI